MTSALLLQKCYDEGRGGQKKKRNLYFETLVATFIDLYSVPVLFVGKFLFVYIALYQLFVSGH